MPARVRMCVHWGGEGGNGLGGGKGLGEDLTRASFV